MFALKYKWINDTTEIELTQFVRIEESLNVYSM